jgi:general secretion pathway protein I
MKSASTGSRAAWAFLRLDNASRHAASAGFSLIEVLVAITVLATTAAVFFPAYSGAMRGVRQTEGHVVAAQLAGSLVEEQARLAVLRPGRLQGRDGVYRWQLAIAPAPDGLAPPLLAGGWVLYEVAVVVEWPARRRYALTTYRLGKAS